MIVLGTIVAALAAVAGCAYAIAARKLRRLDLFALAVLHHAVAINVLTDVGGLLGG